MTVVEFYRWMVEILYWQMPTSSPIFLKFIFQINYVKKIIVLIKYHHYESDVVGTMHCFYFHYNFIRIVLSFNYIIQI